jgi:hypothetical protein
MPITSYNRYYAQAAADRATALVPRAVIDGAHNYNVSESLRTSTVGVGPQLFNGAGARTCNIGILSIYILVHSSSGIRCVPRPVGLRDTLLSTLRQTKIPFTTASSMARDRIH